MKKMMLIAAMLVAHQTHTMTMEQAKTSNKVEKKERSCADKCCGLTKTVCGLAAAYYVITAGQLANESRPCRPSCTATGPAEACIVSTGSAGLEVCKSTSSYDPECRLEPGYVATSWNDLLNVRNRKQYEQTACTMDDDQEGNDVLEKYKDYRI